MRLKGGKVLLDLSRYGEVTIGGGLTCPSSPELFKAIKEKGGRMKFLFGGKIFEQDIVITENSITELECNVACADVELTSHYFKVYINSQSISFETND